LEVNGSPAISNWNAANNGKQPLPEKSSAESSANSNSPQNTAKQEANRPSANDKPVYRFVEGQGASDGYTPVMDHSHQRFIDPETGEIKETDVARWRDYDLKPGATGYSAVDIADLLSWLYGKAEVAAAGAVGRFALKKGMLHFAEKGAAKRAVTLSRDATGEIHGILPKIEELKNASLAQIKETVEELRGSILARKQELELLGEHGPHRARIGEEESLLRSLEKRLEHEFGAKNGP
jgi:hypothetical protein